MKPEIRLRELVLEDKFAISNMLNNKNIWNNLRDYIPYPYSINDAKEFITYTKTKIPTENFGIEYNGKLCGVISVQPQHDVYRLNGEIGYWIGEKYWGKGIATKAIELITDYAFKVLKLKIIYAGIFGFNKASMAVLEKNGYAKEAILKNKI